MTDTPVKISKRQRRKLEKQTVNNVSCLQIKEIKPKTTNQSRAFNAFLSNDNLFLYGVAGTGKSFLSLYLSLHYIMSNTTIYEKLIIVRSIVPSRDIGFLPGNTKEKCREYEAPYEQLCGELFERKDAYNLLKTNGLVHFTSTSFNRSITFNNSIIFVDECQNLTGRELDTIITRVGKNCRIIFAGDMRQNDLVKKGDYSGISDFMKIIRQMEKFKFVEFTAQDILRSSLVKDYIITRMELEDNGIIQPLV